MFTNFKEMTTKEIAPGFLARFIHTENQTFSWVEITKGAILPEHSHVHEQFSRIMQGSFELTIGDTTQICNAGDIALIPSHVAHSGVALTDCVIMDVFTPAREDYK